jgi:hypothetical protein
MSIFGRLHSFVAFFCILAIPAFGQSQDNSPTQTGGGAAVSPSNSSPKKVWTNEDLPAGKSGVSIVGDKHNQAYRGGSTQTADPATVARIKKKLEKLQNQLTDVNSKLKSYKEFQEGEPVSTGERDMSKAYSRTPVDQRMQQLMDKKKQLQTQIGDLLDEARKKGIDPGELR